MTAAQKRLRELRERASKERQRMAELGMAESLDDETRAELDRIETGTPDLERQLRAAAVAVDDEDRASKIENGTPRPDAEQRERIELRSRATVGRYLTAALRGRAPDGAEAELQQAAGVDGIPFELWDRPPEQRQTEDRAITPAPGTVGYQPGRRFVPYVFAPSASWTSSWSRCPWSSPAPTHPARSRRPPTADAVPKGVRAARPATCRKAAAAFTVQTTAPKRIGASPSILAIEDVASVGQANFESLLRQHISLAVSDELDDQMLNGDGANDDLIGIFERLTDPSAPAVGIETWTRFLAIQSGAIDGLWSSELSHIGLVVGPETYRLAAATFQGTDSEDSAASYLKRMGDSFVTNSRMPDTATNVQQGILCRKGRSMMPTPMRTAVCPHWGYFTVDDIYTGALKGQRRFVINTLVGDVILVQPSAYAQVAFRVSV